MLKLKPTWKYIWENEKFKKVLLKKIEDWLWREELLEILKYSKI